MVRTPQKSRATVTEMAATAPVDIPAGLDVTDVVGGTEEDPVEGVGG